MTRLIFERHGYSEGNLLGEFHGHMDGDLTELGHKQAECAGLYLRNRKIDVAYSSDLRRAYKTALHITKYHDIEPIKDENLREIYAGEWEGKKFSELERDYPELYRTWRTNPSEFVSIGGESMRELYDRIKAEVERIVAQNRGKTVLVATHATPLRCLACTWYNKPLSEFLNVGWMNNAAISEIDYGDNGEITPVAVNYTDHLGDLLTALPKII